MPTIYAFYYQKFENDLIAGVAIAEDGTVLAEHVSTNEWWLQYDLGFHESNRKHDEYIAYYPAGYDLQWIDDPVNSPEIKAATDRYALRAEASGKKATLEIPYKKEK